jgi:hypothetical protein
MKSDQPRQTEVTTRQFIAPYTNVAQLPFFNTTLHFVPSKAGETLVYAGGIMASSGPTKFLENHKILSKIIPRKIIYILQEFAHFYFANLADFAYRFYNQDVQIMQGQDVRKSTTANERSVSSWNDMYPTNSDRGVQLFQKWMGRFGGRPSYTMPVANKNSFHSSVHIPSAWDRHAKYCPQCKRTIGRLSKLATIATKFSNGSLALAIASLGINAFIKARLLPWTIAMLAFTVSTRLLAMKCQDTVEKVFLPPNQVPDYQLLQIYSRT